MKISDTLVWGRNEVTSRGVRRAKAGDRPAFDELMRRHEREVIGVAYRIALNLARHRRRWYARHRVPQTVSLLDLVS